MRLRTQFDGILSIIIVDNATLCYLANLCNSTIVEIYFDIIRVSQRFRGCQMLEYIAEIERFA
jgi:hypothetical protein